MSGTLANSPNVEFLPDGHIQRLLDALDWFLMAMVEQARREGEVVTRTASPGRGRNRALSNISGFGAGSQNDIVAQLKLLLEDVFALHVKTKGFHHNIVSPQSRDYRRLLGEQADEIFAMTQGVAGRIRNLGGATTHSRRPLDRETEDIAENFGSMEPPRMLRELREDNAALIMHMIQVYDICDDANDVATTNVLQIWIDETQRRVWFLGDTNERRDSGVVH